MNGFVPWRADSAAADETVRACRLATLIGSEIRSVTLTTWSLGSGQRSRKCTTPSNALDRLGDDVRVVSTTAMQLPRALTKTRPRRRAMCKTISIAA